MKMWSEDIVTIRYMRFYGNDEQREAINNIVTTYGDDEETMNEKLIEFYIDDCMSRN